MKTISRTLLVLYLLVLLWLILFKLSFNIHSVLLDYQTRSLNLIPFAGFSPGNLREIIDNFVVFVPFGLLLSANFKQISFWRKLAFVFLLSFAAEVAQFVFAIGTTDITDVITNTLGGCIGLLLYALGKKYIAEAKLDQFITIAGIIVLIALMWLRVFVLRVRY